MFALFKYSTQTHLIHDGTITNELAGAKKLSWRLISTQVLSELPKTAGLVWDAEQTCPKHQLLWLFFEGSTGDCADDFMWNSCVFLQPPSPLLPACPNLPAPVKNTVLGWTHLSPDPVQHSLCSFKDKNPSLGAGCWVERWDSEFWEQLNEKWQPIPADQYGQGTGKSVWPEGWSSPQNTLKASLLWCNAVICVHLLVMQQLNSLSMLKEKEIGLRKLTQKLSLHYMTNSEVLYA